MLCTDYALLLNVIIHFLLRWALYAKKQKISLTI